eukprot:COSAG01_NODE_434_length_17079_cov_11.829270_3_plen_45_part_00
MLHCISLYFAVGDDVLIDHHAPGPPLSEERIMSAPETPITVART